MDNNVKGENINNAKKSIILSLVICAIGLILTGGTYAYFTMAFDATNSNIVTNTRCFSVNYTDNTNQITGTLFPSAGPAKGLSGSVAFQADTTCGVNGRGTFKLIVDNNTSSTLTNVVEPHCENKYTLETVRGYDISDCNVNDNTVWVTNGTALKYAIFDSTSRNHLYAAGYIDSTFIGNEKTIHSDFSVTTTSKTYYLYIWLDGNVSDNTYANLPFSATSRLDVLQVASNPDPFTGDNYTEITNSLYDYQSFEDNYERGLYLESTGTQYIDTGIKPTTTTDIKVTFSNDGDNIAYQRLFGQSNSAGNTRFQMQMNNTTATSWLVGVGGTNATVAIDATTYPRTVKLVSGEGLYVGDELVSSFDRTETNDYSIWLFRGYDKYSSLKIYSARIWQDGILVRDFGPVLRKTDGAAGMFDLIHGVFYPNAATSGDDFTLGEDLGEPLG